MKIKQRLYYNIYLKNLFGKNKRVYGKALSTLQKIIKDTLELGILKLRFYKVKFNKYNLNK